MGSNGRARAMPTTALRPGGAPLACSARAKLRGLSARTQRLIAAYRARMRRFAAALRADVLARAAALGHRCLVGSLALLRLGWQMRKLGRATCASCCASAA